MSKVGDANTCLALRPHEQSAGGEATSRPRVNQVLPQLDGVLALDKPSGPTSGRCLAALKRLGQRKIGHAGTLDPLAGGVLVVLLGQATKISGCLLEDSKDGGKVYAGTVRLGQISATWDCQGDILEERPWDHVRPEDAAREVAAWCQLTEQDVPPFSAAKHQGQPLYKLARKGLPTPAKVKRIQISRAEALEVRLPWIRFRVACSSGTYVRSLAHSLGMRLGCGAVLTELTREYSHPFGLDAACPLADILADPGLLVERLRPLGDALPHWPCVTLSAAEARAVRQGQPIPCGQQAAERALLLERGQALALARRTMTAKGFCWTIQRGLWNQP